MSEQYAYKVAINHFGEEPTFKLVGVKIDKRTPQRVYLKLRDPVFGSSLYLPAEGVAETPEAALERTIAEHEDQLKREERALARVKQRLSALKAIYTSPASVEKLVTRHG